MTSLDIQQHKKTGNTNIRCNIQQSCLTWSAIVVAQTEKAKKGNTNIAYHRVQSYLTWSTQIVSQKKKK